MAATRAAGADHHLSKPIRPDALIEVLAEILGAAEPRDEAVA
jgi:CheY-like chemotaxis protein